MPPPLGPMPTAEQLAGRVQRVPPLVSLRHDEGPPLGAAMLTWGYADVDNCWHAGICFIYNMFRGTRLTALISVWVPKEHVTPRAGERYADLPRIRLSGAPGGWPELPGRYPKAGGEWLSKHLYASRFDPSGEYRDLRDDILRLARMPRDEDGGQ